MIRMGLIPRNPDNMEAGINRFKFIKKNKTKKEVVKEGRIVKSAS